MKILLQERVKTSWRAKTEAKARVEERRKILQTTLTSEDFDKVNSIRFRAAEVVFLRFKERQIEKFSKLRTSFSKGAEVEFLICGHRG